MFYKCFIALIFAALANVSLASTTSDNSVVFSIKPLALIYMALLEGTDSPAVEPAQILYPATSNLHDHQLAISDIKKLLNAQTLYWLGDANEEHLVSLLPRFKQLKSPALMAQASAHVWLNPQQLPALISKMAQQLSVAMPAKASRIKQNSIALQRSLNELFTQYQQRLSKYQHTPVLIVHVAFSELLADLKLDSIISYSQGHSHGNSDIGTKAKLQVQQMIKQGKITCALEEPDISFAGLKKRFKYLHSVRLEPMAASSALQAGSFRQFMQQSLEAIESCLTFGNVINEPPSTRNE